MATGPVADDPRPDDGALFARLYPGLRRFAAVCGSFDTDPDDLVQEAVARTLRRHALAELDDAAAYLRQAIVHLASNHRRGAARWRAAVLRLGGGDESRAPEYGSDLADLLRLDGETRALLYLVAVEGNTYAVAAAVLGISEEAARARAARARKRLRFAIVEEDEWTT